tara:strand:- start:165 stop:656 length:492 start_codon:yes stop_codon:yes gene_type:complete
MPDSPPPPSGIDERIAEAVANEDYELAARLKKMKTQPPPPPPPKKGKKAPPPPPPKKGKKAPPPKGRPKGLPKARPKRRRRLRLRMKSKTIAEEEDSYTDRIGWNASIGTVLEDNEEIVEEPKTITHQCSMCGSMMTIPKPKRERYRIVCSYPQCGHSDTVGI